MFNIEMVQIIKIYQKNIVLLLNVEEPTNMLSATTQKKN